MATHVRTPKPMNRKDGYTGVSPSGSRVGESATNLFNYLNNWAMNYQMLSYSGDAYCTLNTAGDTHGDTSGPKLTKTNGYFYLPIWSPPQHDGEDRLLNGALMPWSTTFIFSGGVRDDYAYITWQQDGGAEVTLWEDPGNNTDTDSDDLNLDSRLKPPRMIELGYGSDGEELFTYTPDSSADWVYGRIKTNQIRTAALGIWPGPHRQLSDTQARFLAKYMCSGNAIRGHSGWTENPHSLGDMFQCGGFEDAVGGYDDMLFCSTRRYLFGWAHPCGVWWDGHDAYETLGGADTSYVVSPQNWNSTYEGSQTTVSVAVVMSSLNAAVGDPASIKIVSEGTADFVELQLTADPAGWPELVTGSLDILTAGDKIQIGLRAPDNGATGEVVLHSVSIVDQSWG